MPIEFNNNIFHIYNDSISYCIELSKYKDLLHIYYGKRIDSNNIYILKRDRASFSAYEGKDYKYSLDVLPQEYPMFGAQDMRSPALEFEYEDGRYDMCNMRYKSHKIIQGKPDIEGLPHIYENSSGFFLFNLLNLFYLIRFNCNETFINDAKKLIESNLDAINSKDLSIFYCILGIYYKRNPSTNFVAEKYFKKCLSLSSNIPDIAALCTFELISIYAETNRSALAYTYCEKSRSIFNRLQNYTTMFFIDFFQCNCLTNLGLYESSIQKLTELLNNIDQSSNKYISTMYHSLAWCYLLNCQYSECIKYTNLAIENKDPSCDLCYFIPYSYYKQKEYLKCLDYIESHLEYADDFYKPFLQSISARIQKQYIDFEKNIILYYQSLLQNNVYEGIPLIQNFILDYYTETNNKDMMIKILIDIKSFNDKDLTLKSSTLFVDSSR